jgi:hypothetical protein
MASVTLYQQHGLSRLRLWPPRGNVRSVVVLERRGGYLLVTHDQPVDPMTFIGGRYRHLFEVNMTPLPVTYERYVLPSSELARSFMVNLELIVKVEDALKVVREQKTDPWDAIEPLLRLPLRQIGRKHSPEQVADVEVALHRYLTDRPVPEAGLRIVRAGVTVNMDSPDLKRVRDKIEDRHRRELDELNAKFRVMLEKEEAQHRRLLVEEHERHLRTLEDQRRLLYEQVVGEGVIPKLLLIKLGARPAGGDPKEIDEVIELMKQVKVDDFKVPLELLADYTHVMERWQLEEPVTTLLRRLIATFEPQIAPPSKPVDQVEGSSTEAVPPDRDPTIP